jgi:streptogramin lyase
LPSSEPDPTPTLAPGVTALLDLDYYPSGITASDDLLWLEDHATTNKVYALDPETEKTRATVDVTRPCDIVAAFDRIWVADLDAGELAWIDPTTLEIGGHVVGFEGPCGVQAVDGAIWLAVDSGLARVDPDTESVITTELGDAAFPGTGKPLWAALYDTGDLVPIDADTGHAGDITPYPDGPSEGPPLATGFGALWVGSFTRDVLYRLNPRTGAVEAEIEVATPTRLLVTNDAVWTTSYPQGVVTRIDPETNEVVFRAALGGTLNGITEGFGSIWVAETGKGLLYRIDPAATGVTP